MEFQSQERCAYCERPLHLVAGFCVACHAPASVAQRARLVADVSARARRARLAATALTQGVRVEVLEAPNHPPPPSASWVRVAFLVGTIAVVIAGLSIGLRLHGGSLAEVFIPAPGSEIGVSTSANGASATHFVTGQTLYLRYTTSVDGDSADIALMIAPDSAPTRALVERWAHGRGSRVQPFIPLTAGTWHFRLTRDGALVQSADITFTTVFGDVSTTIGPQT